MENKKLTKKDYFEMIKGICGDREDIVSFCDHEIELLSRKNSKSGATKTQTENIKVAEMLVAELAKVARPITITDLMNTSEVVKAYKLENGNTLSNQKISAIFKQLVDNKTIVKVIDKKKSYFSVAD
jgi:hypothetical protein